MFGPKFGLLLMARFPLIIGEKFFFSSCLFKMWTILFKFPVFCFSWFPFLSRLFTENRAGQGIKDENVTLSVDGHELRKLFDYCKKFYIASRNEMMTSTAV